MGNLAIVMCTWKRVNLLGKTLDMLEQQKYKDFDLYIWNNNKGESTNIDNIVRKSSLNINVHHSNENIGGIGRFYWAEKIMGGYDKILFIDDDQIFSKFFVGQMVSFYKEGTIISWWGWKINNNYFDRERKYNLDIVDYCGTGGMILPSVIFSNNIIFNIPKKFLFVEDLWLSYVAKYELGYELRGCNADIEIKVDGKDQYIGLKSQKQELLDYLKLKYQIK